MTHRTAAIAAMVIVGAFANYAPAPSSAPAATGSDQVVTFAGIADVRFGDTVAELTADHGLTKPPGACVMQFADLTGVDPVFVDNRLVLLWAHAPVRTPEGISEGSAVDAVRQAYSGEVELTPPAGSHAYPAIMVRQGDAAYLFLHDGTTVQKEIAGYADYVQRLYTDGFGAC
ncbi:hypothetical protein [Hamadaea sp.]|uniref:hypothetical protein n=1 Tax=Hamadaea sp. TaxID=2024425 RepID=UPI0025C6C122|nr:hypothetical protein [Hamadaea sp.]